MKTSAVRRIGMMMIMLALLAAGCASQGIRQRIEQKPQAYASLPAETQAQVQRGEVRPGMAEDAVYMAWGKPGLVLGNPGPPARVTWIYYGNSLREYRYWTIPDYEYGRTSSTTAQLRTGVYPRTYAQAEVTFENGVVKEVRRLQPPPAD